jgi:photosystem II stability/assembly factor-like uncharacterized protein
MTHATRTLALALAAAASAPLAAQTAPPPAAEPAFGALNAAAECPTGVDPTEDLDGDCLDDDLERSGFDKDLEACTPGADGCFVTDPTAWSTDGDPYSDFQEATGVNMEATVESPYRHPLVAAAPQIEVRLDSYQYAPRSTITDSQGQSVETGFETTFSVESTTAVTTTVGAEASLFEGPKVSTETEVSQSLTVGFSATASYNQELNWETATTTTANEAAELTLFLRARNTGGGTAKNVRPVLNVTVGGELIGTVRPADPFPSNLTPGDALSDPVVVDRRVVGTETEPITVTLEQLRRLRRGAPIGVRVVGLEAEVERWNSADSNWSCGTASEPCLWESFQDQIDARTLRLGLDYGYSGDPAADVPARYFGNPFDYRVYTGSPAGSAGYTLRDVLGFLGVAEGSGAAFQINGRPFPSAWLAVSGPQRDRQGRRFLDHWEAWADADDEWPRDLLDMAMPRNAHLALVSPDPVDPFPLAGENLVTGTMRRVLVAVGTKGSIPVVEAEAHLFQHGVETVVPMERLPGSAVWATPDSLVVPISVGSSYVVLRDYLGEESVVGPGLTPAFPVEAGTSGSPCGEIDPVAYRAPDFGSDRRGFVTVFIDGDPDQPATAFCDSVEDPVTYYWYPQTKPASGGSGLTGVAVLDAAHRVVVGDDVILRTENGGQTWIDVDPPADAPFPVLEAVAFRPGALGAEVGLAVGQVNVVLRTTDGGRSWARVTMPSPSSQSFRAVAHAGGTTWFVVGDGRGYRSTDDGETWEEALLDFVDADGNAVPRPGLQALRAVAFASETEGVVGDARTSSGTGYVYATRDGGATWQQVVAVDGIRDIAYNGRDGWVVVQTNSSGGRVFFEEDLLEPLASEITRVIGTSVDVEAVDFGTPEVGFVIDEAGAVWRTEDGGRTWAVSTGYQRPDGGGFWLVRDIDMLDANIGALVGTGNALGATDSGGGFPTYETTGGVTAEGGPDEPLAPGVSLAAPAPNPFRQSTRVRYALDAPGRARLAVYDALGREVAVLVDGERPAGEHETQLEARGLAAGVYVVRLTGEGAAATRTVTVVR